MRGRLALVAALLALLAPAMAVAALGSRGDWGPVYSVAAVRARLARNPGVWVGRTIWVRGMVIPAGCETWLAPESESCRDWRQGIVDPDGLKLLPLALGAPHPLLAFLRRLPLLGRVLPTPPSLRWGTVASYCVRLGPAPTTVCAAAPCYEAVLLDAAPGSR